MSPVCRVRSGRQRRHRGGSRAAVTDGQADERDYREAKMAVAEMDDLELERLMALTRANDSDDEDGMAYGFAELPKNLPPASSTTEAEDSEPEPEQTIRLGQAPTFSVNAAQFVVEMPTSDPVPSFIVNNEPVVFSTHEPVVPVPAEILFESGLLSRAIGRDDASRLFEELREFLGTQSDTSGSQSEKVAALQEEISQLRAAAAAAKEAAEAEAAAEVAAAKAKARAAESRAAMEKAQAEMAASRVRAEAEAVAEAQRAAAAEARKEAALEAHRQAEAEEVEPVPANVFDFSNADEVGAAVDEEASAGSTSSVSKVTKVLRSLSFGKRGARKK